MLKICLFLPVLEFDSSSITTSFSNLDLPYFQLHFQLEKLKKNLSFTRHIKYNYIAFLTTSKHCVNKVSWNKEKNYMTDMVHIEAKEFNFICLESMKTIIAYEISISIAVNTKIVWITAFKNIITHKHVSNLTF